MLPNKICSVKMEYIKEHLTAKLKTGGFASVTPPVLWYEISRKSIFVLFLIVLIVTYSIAYVYL